MPTPTHLFWQSYLNSKLLALMVVCAASMVCLVGLGVPEPVTVTFTSTQAAIFTGSQSSTLIVPQASVITAVSYPRTEVGGIWLYYTTLCNYNYADQPPTTICATETTYTTTVASLFTYVNFMVTSYTTTENYSTLAPPPALIASATWATLTYSPILSTSTSATTTTATSYTTQTGESTQQTTPISSGVVNQAAAVAFAVVLAVSLLAISRMRKPRV